jgi:hypothetical protein
MVDEKKKAKILVVDDEERFRKSLTDRHRAHGLGFGYPPLDGGPVHRLRLFVC